MRRILLHVAYDGTAYSGWQLQSHEETIESVLNRELSALCNENIRVIGASRTDAGVHARDALAVFDTDTRIPGDKFSYALNQRLPEDVRIRKSQEVPCDFHPRKVALRKTYTYHIWHDEFEMPDRRLYTHHVYTPLDMEAMQKAAEYFVGEHDFAAFCGVGNQTETTVRTIYAASVEYVPGTDEREIVIAVCGNGFLYHMVRIIAGTLICVGQGKIAADDLPGIIASCDRAKAGPTAPAKGLMLEKYEIDAFLTEIDAEIP